jgi:hypothetical protein
MLEQWKADTQQVLDELHKKQALPFQLAATNSLLGRFLIQD